MLTLSKHLQLYRNCLFTRNIHLLVPCNNQLMTKQKFSLWNSSEVTRWSNISHATFRREGFCSSSHDITRKDFISPILSNDVENSELVNKYTAPALAAAFQDRERTLLLCAQLLKSEKIQELKGVLDPYTKAIPSAIASKASAKDIEHSQLFSKSHLKEIRTELNRLPRQITKATSRRAAVIIPLCHSFGVPSILFTLRSNKVFSHKGEVCFPGGMVESKDNSIFDTCLRELVEEVGVSPEKVNILGILRCDWSQIASITGVSVTPVVGYMGELKDMKLEINEDEVESCFTVPITDLMKRDNWIIREYSAPVFTGGPHVTWGLTAYIVNNFLNDVLHCGELKLFNT